MRTIGLKGTKPVKAEAPAPVKKETEKKSK